MRCLQSHRGCPPYWPVYKFYAKKLRPISAEPHKEVFWYYPAWRMLRRVFRGLRNALDFRSFAVQRDTDFAYIGEEHLNGNVLPTVPLFRAVYYQL